MTVSANDNLAILALYAAYNRCIDTGDVVGWLNTFTSDGVFHHPSRMYAGNDQLRSFIAGRSAQLEAGAVTNMTHWNDPIVLSGDRDSVNASCRLLVTGMARETGKLVVVAEGRYEDSLVRSENGWQFKERRLALV